MFDFKSKDSVTDLVGMLSAYVYLRIFSGCKRTQLHVRDILSHMHLRTITCRQRPPANNRRVA